MRNIILATTILSAGCGGLLSPEAADPEREKKTSIIGKKTQEIGEFDAKADVEVSDSKIRATNPLTYAVEARQPMIEKIMKSHIQHAVRLFEAVNARYPKDHEEFMEKVIKANNIKLEELGGGWKYQYDVDAHELRVVRDRPAEKSKQ